jgi:hypothetical protein
MMMQNRNAELHAEGNQRQPDQSKPGSRSLHAALSFAPRHESSDLMSQSWRPVASHRQYQLRSGIPPGNPTTVRPRSVPHDRLPGTNEINEFSV